MTIVKDRAEMRVHAPGEPPDLAAMLRAFRRDHPPKTLTYAGQRWTYYTGGEGSQAVMLLPGGTGAGELWFRHLLELKGDYHTIAVTYAPVSTMSQLTDGLVAIMDAEGIQAAALAGASLGGMAAQCFARRYPERTTHMLLANTTIPDPAAAPRMRRMERIVRLMPERLVNWTVNRSLSGHATDLPGGAFWTAMFAETAATSMGKARFISQFQLLYDFCVNYRFAPADLANAPLPMLIVESADDDKINPQQRQALREAYPQARVQAFAQAGHLSAVSHFAEFLTLLRSLLQS